MALLDTIRPSQVKTIFVVRIKQKNVEFDGGGYHSAWSYRDGAERVVDALSCFSHEYWIEEMVPSECDVRQRNDALLSVGLPGALGRMILNTPMRA